MSYHVGTGNYTLNVPFVTLLGCISTVLVGWMVVWWSVVDVENNANAAFN